MMTLGNAYVCYDCYAHVQGYVKKVICVAPNDISSNAMV